MDWLFVIVVLVAIGTGVEVYWTLWPKDPPKDGR